MFIHFTSCADASSSPKATNNIGYGAGVSPKPQVGMIIQIRR